MIKKVLSVVAVTAALMGSSAAFAQSSIEPRDTQGAPALQVNYSCGANGTPCVETSWNGYIAKYTSSSNFPKSVQFQLVCGDGYSAWDNGAFTIFHQQTRQFEFSVGAHGWCEARVHDYSNGAVYTSGYTFK